VCSLSEEQKSSQTEDVKVDEQLEDVSGKGLFVSLRVPFLSVFTGLLIGAIIIAVSNAEVVAAWKNLFQDPIGALSLTWITVRDAYVALFEGSFGNPKTIVQAIGVWRDTGETRAVLDALRPISESLVISTPYIFAGLAVALGFRGGLFNIGAEGQLFVGGLASAFIGYAIKGLPAYIHLPLALLAGISAGAIWGAIPGYLKARTGAHEVINTIMMNYIANRAECIHPCSTAQTGSNPLRFFHRPGSGFPGLLVSMEDDERAGD